MRKCKSRVLALSAHTGLRWRMAWHTANSAGCQGECSGKCAARKTYFLTPRSPRPALIIPQILRENPVANAL